MLALPDTQRNNMDAEFRDIFEMSFEKGCRAILDKVLCHLSQDADRSAANAFGEMLVALTSHYQRALVTFLDYSPFWKGALAQHFYMLNGSPDLVERAQEAINTIAN